MFSSIPTAKPRSDEVLEKLTHVFRTVGYEGATLSKLSRATGLQRASLYHRFPGGKKQMAEAVLSHAAAEFAEHILNPLTGLGSPRGRLEALMRNLDSLYSEGVTPCLLDAFSRGKGGEIFGVQISGVFERWVGAIALIVAETTECTGAQARQRAEDAVISIQGALVLCRGTRDKKPFQRILKTLPDTLLASPES